MGTIVEMFWVADYGGDALPQFNPETGLENSFSQVDHRKVKRFWWLPITSEMEKHFPNTRFNPLLKNHGVDLNGSKGFVTRRTEISIRKDGRPPVTKVRCYVIGIEGGPRQEIYPDGTVISKALPESERETQDLLHH
jgi:hypothetical protein